MKNFLSTYYILFDTEFADFTNLALLSIGLVTEDKKYEFYKEVNDYDPESCSDFVIKNIIPLMDYDNHGLSYRDLSESLIKWINGLPCNEVILVADYSGDITIWERLISLPGAVKLEKKVFSKTLSKAFNQATIERGLYDHRNIHKAFKAMTDGISHSLSKTPEMQHHALYDAHANCDGWIAGINTLKNI